MYTSAPEASYEMFVGCDTCGAFILALSLDFKLVTVVKKKTVDSIFETCFSRFTQHSLQISSTSWQHLQLAISITMPLVRWSGN
jgi:hypothetical protein